MTKHKPATLSAMPLRAEQRYQSAERSAIRGAVILDAQGAWIATTGDKPTADYIAHAANAYPKLIEALRKASEVARSAKGYSYAKLHLKACDMAAARVADYTGALLRELREDA